MQKISTTVQDAAAMIGISRASIYRLMSEGKIDTVKVRGRRLVKTDSIRALVDQAA